MIYLIATADEYELPLAVAGTLNEAAQMCGVETKHICKIIKNNSKTKAFGTPARIYKFQEDENDII